MVLRPLPFPDAERLVAIYNTYPGAGWSIGPNSVVEYLDRRPLTALAELATSPAASAALLAIAIPARRAARIDPTVALTGV